MPNRPRHWRLAVLMTLIYAVQGSWWPLLAVHLGDLGIRDRGRGWIFATLAFSSLITPMWAGHVADRWVAIQHLLAILYGLGTGLLLIGASGAFSQLGSLLALFLAYWLITAPGLGLGGSLAYRNLEHPTREFGAVRLWGTVGWMAIGWVVSLAMAARGTSRAGQGAYEAFWVAATVSATFALYCLSLPHTPPLLRGHGPQGRNWLEARSLFRKPGVLTLLVSAFLVSLTTPFVYQAVPPYLPTLGLGRAWVASAMTLGQVPEVLALAILPRVLNRLGTKRTLALGISAWIAYFGIMATRPPLALALFAVMLNGVAIALFHIVGPLFLDGQAPADRRASVQGFYVMVTAGVGSLLGNLLAGEVMARGHGVGPRIFLVPAAIDAATLIGFLACFRSGGPLDPVRGVQPPPSHRASSRKKADSGSRTSC